MSGWRVCLALCCGLIAGCFQLSQPSPDIREYRLDYLPPTVTGTLLPVTVRIAPLGVAAMYDRQPIVYRDGLYSGGTYFYARWGTNPGAMLTDIVARDVAHSHLYTAVQRGPGAMKSDYQLGGEIEELEERAGSDGCSAHVRLRMLLVRLRVGKGNAALLQASYSGDEPCTCNDPQAVVAAMSTALQHVSGQLQQAVYDAIAADLAHR